MSKYKKATKKLNTAVSLYKTSKSIYVFGKSVHKWYQIKTSYSVTISSDEHDDFFLHVALWLFGELQQETKGARIVTVTKNGRSAREWDTPTHDLTLKLVGDLEVAPKFIVVEGHRIKVSYEETEGSPGRSGKEIFTFLASSKEGQTALVAKLTALFELLQQKTVPLRIFTTTKDADTWRRGSESEFRDLESVILAEGQLERIVADFQMFKDSKEQYHKYGMPYHRGYLFFGPPGTGKTSLVKALAKNFQKSVYSLPLGDIKNDASLASLLAEITPNSILLLEDVDVFSSVTNRNDKAKKLSLSGLLNALDGVATPDGLITIMTTNYEDALDDALLRAGRVDVKERLGELTHEQGDRLFEFIYGRKPDVSIDWTGVSPAEAMEVFKQNMNDPTAAEKVLL